MKYWYISVKLPYYLKGVDLTHSLQRCIVVLYYGVGFLNILIPSSLGWMHLILDSKMKAFVIWESTIFVTLMLEVLSCIFLFDALRRVYLHALSQNGVIDTK